MCNLNREDRVVTVGDNYIIAVFPFSDVMGQKKRVRFSCVKLLQIAQWTVFLIWRSISSTMSMMYFDRTTLAEAEFFIIANLIFVVPEIPPHASVKTSLGDAVSRLAMYRR